jgi:hypothetical protein
LEVPFANVTSATLDSADNQLTVIYDGDLTGMKIAVWATAPLSKGTKFVKNKLRQIAVKDGFDAADFNVDTEYKAKFGAYSDTDNIVIGLRVVNANGQASPLETIKAIPSI